MSISRHAGYNLVGMIIPPLVQLVTIPLYLHHVGLDRYGVLAISWLLLGYFNLFDFGIGRATSQRLATLVDAEDADRSRLFWLSLRITGLLASAGTLLLLPALVVALGLIKVPTAALRAEFHGAIPLLALCLPLGMLNSLLSGALMGRRAFLRMNALNVFSSTATAVLPLVAALLWSPRLPALISAALVGRLLSTLLLLLACRRAVPILPPAPALPGEMHGLFRFGGWLTVSNIIAPVLTMWDRFLIGAVVGAAAVTIYVVPFNLVSQISLLPFSLTSAMYPLLASGSSDDRHRIARKALASLSLVITPAVLLALVAVEPFLRLWLGDTRGGAAAPVACLLLYGIWANSFALVPAVHLEAQARPSTLAKLHLSEVVPYVVLLYFAVRAFGVAGAAFVWSLRTSVDAAALFTVTREPVPAFMAIEAALVAAGISTLR